MEDQCTFIDTYSVGDYQVLIVQVLKFVACLLAVQIEYTTLVVFYSRCVFNKVHLFTYNVVQVKN